MEARKISRFIEEHPVTRNTAIGLLGAAFLGITLGEAAQVHGFTTAALNYGVAAVAESARWGIPESGFSDLLSRSEGRQTLFALGRIAIAQLGLYTLGAGAAQSWIGDKASRQELVAQGRAPVSINKPTLMVLGGESSTVAAHLSSKFPINGKGDQRQALLLGEGMPVDPPDHWINMHPESGVIGEDASALYLNANPYGLVRFQQERKRRRDLRARADVAFTNGKMTVIGCGEMPDDVLSISDHAGDTDFSPQELTVAARMMSSQWGVPMSHIRQIYIGNPDATVETYGFGGGEHAASSLSPDIHWIDPGMAALSHALSNLPRQKMYKISFSSNIPGWQNFERVINQWNEDPKHVVKLELDHEDPDMIFAQNKDVVDTLTTSIYLADATLDKTHVFAVTPSEGVVEQFRRVRKDMGNNPTLNVLSVPEVIEAEIDRIINL